MGIVFRAATARLVRSSIAGCVRRTSRPGAHYALIESFARPGRATRQRSKQTVPSPLRMAKSPIEFAVGLARALEALVPTTPLGHDLAALGQDVCQPPTIQGWEGGRAWINATTLLGRSNLAASMLSSAEPYGNKLDPQAVARKHGHDSLDAAGPFLLDLLVQGDLDAQRRAALLQPPAGIQAEPARGQWLRQLVRTIATLPEFQLA